MNTPYWFRISYYNRTFDVLQLNHSTLREAFEAERRMHPRASRITAITAPDLRLLDPTVHAALDNANPTPA